MKIQAGNYHPAPSTPPASQLLDRDLREFLWSIRNQLRDPPEEDYDAYCERAFELVKSRRRIPKDFAKRYSPRRHRPTSAAWLAKMAEQARQRFLLGKAIKNIDNDWGGESALSAEHHASVCSAHSKEMRRFEQKVFRRSFPKWMSKRPRMRYTKVISALEGPASFNLRRVPKPTISAEAVPKIFLELRESLHFPECLTEKQSQELVRRLNHHYHTGRHKKGAADREMVEFYPEFVGLFCTPQL